MITLKHCAMLLFIECCNPSRPICYINGCKYYAMKIGSHAPYVHIFHYNNINLVRRVRWEMANAINCQPLTWPSCHHLITIGIDKHNVVGSVFNQLFFLIFRWSYYIWWERWNRYSVHGLHERLLYPPTMQVPPSTDTSPRNC